MPVTAVCGPAGVDGVEMFSPVIVTTSPGETLDTTEVLTADRACTVTVYVPGDGHE